MLKYLKLENIGPALELELELSPRVNMITGDNGLGKSFLLDAAWFAHTGLWPSEVNPKLSVGLPARPKSDGPAAIKWADSLSEMELDSYRRATYQGFDFGWHFSETNLPRDKRLVIYLMSDNSVAVFDPLRHHAAPTNQVVNNRKCLVFDPTQVWNGLMDEESNWQCNGLIRDWATWQGEGATAFDNLKSVLSLLSPSETNLLQPGGLRRISIEDSRRMPTISMPYEGEVPLIHTSAALRRILAFAYLIVWAWDEHQSVAKIRRTDPIRDILILFDEVEAHLHPSWQRKILPALMSVGTRLERLPNLQLIATTHSPLVMASLEPHFDSEKDAWFDLDLVRDNGAAPHVELTKREFQKLGGANDWLVSEAFDQKQPGISIEAERTLEKASAALKAESIDLEEVNKIDQDMARYLSPTDPTWTIWRMSGKQKGWWP